MRVKKWIIIFFLFTFSLIPSITSASERIDDFSAVIVLNSDSSLNITENISFDFGEQAEKGFSRNIPVEYETESGSKKIKITIEKLLVDGSEIEYDAKKENGVLKIRPDGESALSGKKEYTLKYRVLGAIDFLNEKDELFWNYAGPGMSAVVLQSKVEIVLPEAILQRQLETSCYAGEPESKDKCVSKRYIFRSKDMVQKVVFADDKLMPEKRAVFALSLPKGVLQKPSFFDRNAWLINLMIFTLPVLALAALFYILYRKKQKRLERKNRLKRVRQKGRVLSQNRERKNKAE